MYYEAIRMRYAVCTAAFKLLQHTTFKSYPLLPPACVLPTIYIEERAHTDSDDCEKKAVLNGCLRVVCCVTTTTTAVHVPVASSLLFMYEMPVTEL